jgi:hypothetical protein
VFLQPGLQIIQGDILQVTAFLVIQQGVIIIHPGIHHILNLGAVREILVHLQELLQRTSVLVHLEAVIVVEAVLLVILVEVAAVAIMEDKI